MLANHQDKEVGRVYLRVREAVDGRVGEQFMWTVKWEGKWIRRKKVRSKQKTRRKIRRKRKNEIRKVLEN